MSSISTRQTLLDQLAALRLPAFRWALEAQLASAEYDALPFEERLALLVEHEHLQRQENRIKRRVRQARFQLTALVQEIDFSASRGLPRQFVLQLAQTTWIRKALNLLITGPTGVGKTHLAIGLARAACYQGRKVRFWTAAGLVSELLQAQDEHRFHRMIAAALKLDLVVLDELGFIPFSSNGSQALFTFCSELYERTPMIITTNLKFADWIQVFGDERLTAALLDRLTHHAHLIELLGESFRFRERMSQS